MSKRDTTPAFRQTNQDFKNALLVVSLVINLFVLTTWMVASLSPSHAAQLSQLVK
jgi:hypothetical protein